MKWNRCKNVEDHFAAHVVEVQLNWIIDGFKIFFNKIIFGFVNTSMSGVEGSLKSNDKYDGWVLNQFFIGPNCLQTFPYVIHSLLSLVTWEGISTTVQWAPVLTPIL